MLGLRADHLPRSLLDEVLEMEHVGSLTTFNFGLPEETDLFPETEEVVIGRQKCVPRESCASISLCDYHCFMCRHA